MTDITETAVSRAAEDAAEQPGSTPSPLVCEAVTRTGARCRRRAIRGDRFCAQHATRDAPLPADIDQAQLRDVVSQLGDAPRVSGANFTSSMEHELRQFADVAGGTLKRFGQTAVASGLVDPERAESFLGEVLEAGLALTQAVTDRLNGDIDEDDFGFDDRFTMGLLPMAALLYKYYWRVDVTGIENVPASGRGLLVSNHAGGGLPVDGAMIKTALQRESDTPRHVRLLVLDWLMGLPWLGSLMRTTGQALACSPNAVQLLEREQLVAVFPEGLKGIGKPFSERYNLQRFGRGGFVRIALKTGAPIIPVAVVGSEEIYPKLANLPFLHRLIGAPYIPITPTFPLLGLAGLLPLPSKWNIEFCDPIDVSQYGPEAADDRAFVLELSERVRAVIQERLRANLLKRTTPFLVIVISAGAARTHRAP